MAATNIFYRIPSQRGIKIATLTGSECTLHQFCDYIIDSEGLNRNDFIVASGTKVFRPNSCNLQSISLRNNSHIDILIPLLGGKGGFGSLLRAIGAQIEKTTNRDACRDLSGRRLRDIKREEELKKLLALQEKLIEEKERRKQEKLDKLRQKTEASKTCKSIQELVAMFDDHNYNKRRLEIGDILEAAVDKGIINFQKMKKGKKSKIASQTTTNKIGKSDHSLNQEDDSASQSNEESSDCDTESKGETSYQNSSKKKDIWLGLDEELV